MSFTQRLLRSVSKLVHAFHNIWKNPRPFIERGFRFFVPDGDGDHGVGSTDHFLKFLYYTSFLTPHSICIFYVRDSLNSIKTNTIFVFSL